MQGRVNKHDFGEPVAQRMKLRRGETPELAAKIIEILHQAG